MSKFKYHLQKEIEETLGKVLAKLFFKGIKHGKKFLALLILILLFLLLLFLGLVILLFYLAIQLVDWLWDSLLQLIRTFSQL